MRNAFAAQMTELASKEKDLVLLSGDIGNQLFDKYKEAAGDRFYNCGVAEQNMIGVAAGFALGGYLPVAYTIVPFITSRCFEQIRVDVCYHEVPVTIVGVGAGLSYASLGATHHSCEDVSILRSLPNMTVVCPCDQEEVKAVVREIPKYRKPLYIRLGKKGEPKIHNQAPKFEIGKAIQLSQGDDVAILGCGNIMAECVHARELLEKEGIKASLYSFHTVKPLDEETLTNVFNKTKLVITVEEHSRIGGIGSAVAEWMSDQTSFQAPLLRIGTGDWFLHEAGEQEYARHRYGLTAEDIRTKIAHRLKHTSE